MTALPSGATQRYDGPERVDLVAVAAPVDERSEPEAGEQLRELGGMAERVGRVRDARGRPDRRRHPPALEQVPDVRLARGQERVGLHVPRPDGEPSRPDTRLRARRAGRDGPRGSPRRSPTGRRAGTASPASAASRSSTRSTVSTSRARNAWNVRYHSRSQWVCETIRHSIGRSSHRATRHRPVQRSGSNCLSRRDRGSRYPERPCGESGRKFER